MKRLAKKWLAVPDPPWHAAVTVLQAMDHLISAYLRKYDRRRAGPLTLTEYEAGKIMARRAGDKSAEGDR